MSATNRPLPAFADPPVVEVALSVQFDSITSLRTPQLGLLWQEFRVRFPMTEEHAPLPAAIERFGARRSGKLEVRLEMLQTPPLPRCWFLNAEGTELIQVQQDRFAHNWRKVGKGDQYPRYKHIRETFAKELERFRAFLEREELGELNPNQCEVTYVNHIFAGKGSETHGDLGEVLTVFEPRYSDTFLASVEDVRMKLTHVIADPAGKPLGRLHITVDPTYREDDGQPMWVLKLTARGGPTEPGIDGVLHFIDIGREWVVRGFASITTDKMHKIWERKDDNCSS